MSAPLPPRRAVAVAALLVGSLSPAVMAAPTQVLLEGRFGKFDRFDPLNVERSFTLRLTYNDRGFDPALTSFGGGVTAGYLADDWEWAFFEGKQVVAASTPRSNPEAAGFISVLSTGGDPDGATDESIVTVGLHPETPGHLEDAFDGSALVTATFQQDETFPGLDMPTFPAELAFTSGQILFDSRSFSLHSATLTSVEMSEGGSAAAPAPVPTPTAAAAGVVALAGLLARRRRDAE